MSQGRQPVVPTGKSSAQILAEKREAQLSPDSAMTKLAPDGVDLNPPKANPLEPAVPHMENVQAELEQLVETARAIYRHIDQIKTSGDASAFLDTRLQADPELWESKAKEVSSIKNKLLTTLPVRGV